MNITIDDIRSKGPCYDPVRYLPEGWEGTLIDVLSITDCPPEDRIWVVTRFLDDRTNRLFAVWCAREALKLVDNPDPRSVATCDVAERYANGQATADELAAAWAAAGVAAGAAAGDAAGYAARYASRDAAGAAAGAAAWAAAWDAAWDAAWAAAWAAARAAARDAQKNMFLDAVENEFIALGFDPRTGERI